MKKQNKTKVIEKNWRQKTLHIIAIGGLITLLGLGIFAQMGWLPKTDSKTGERNGWFGMKIAKDSKSSNWNPFASKEPQPRRVPPSLSKEYIYAGDRMLAVEDYAQPTPTITPTPTPGGGSGGGGGNPTPTPQETYTISWQQQVNTSVISNWSRSVNKASGVDSVVITTANSSTVLATGLVGSGTSGTVTIFTSNLATGSYKLRYMKNGSIEMTTASFFYISPASPPF